MGDYFFRKPVKVLVVLGDKKEITISELAKAVRTSLSHVIRIIKQLEKMGLAETERRGRNRIVTATEKGKKIGRFLGAVSRMLNGSPQKQ